MKLITKCFSMMTIDLPGMPVVDLSVFDEPEIMLMKALLERGGHDNLGAVINNMTPDKEKVIAAIQAAFRPQSFVFKSRTQQEFEIWMAQHGNEITPELEREWQKKIDDERGQYLQMISGDNMIEKIEITAKGGSKTEHGMISNNLVDVADLPESSREKLNAVGVTSIEQFRAMPYEDKQKILGYKVAGRFKDFNT